MANHITDVEDIRTYIRKGYPNGTKPVIASLNLLFARIEELERSLAPFARVGANTNDGLPLVHVNHRDCVNAKNKLDPNQSVRTKTPQQEQQDNEIWWPAE